MSNRVELENLIQSLLSHSETFEKDETLTAEKLLEAIELQKRLESVTRSSFVLGKEQIKDAHTQKLKELTDQDILNALLDLKKQREESGRSLPTSSSRLIKPR